MIDAIDKITNKNYELLDLQEVIQETGLQISELVEKIKSGQFPKEIATTHLHGQPVNYLWCKSDVYEWVRSKIQRTKPKSTAEYLDVDKSTGQKIVIQTPSREISLTVEALMLFIKKQKVSKGKPRLLSFIKFGKKAEK